MKVYGLSLTDVSNTVATVDEINGWDNLIVNPDSRDISNSRGPRARFTLRVRNSCEEPARYAASGRHTRAASWEAHRDVIRALFAAGATRIETAHADYRSATNFEETYRDTYYHNVGSQMFPAFLGSLAV